MRTVTYRLADLQRAIISIGFVGENEYTRVQFDALKVFEEYPSAIPTMAVVNPSGTAYPVVVTRDGDYVIWDVEDSDLTAQGRGEAQLTFTSNGVVVKSYVFRTTIDRSIVANGEAPDPIQTWIDEANEIIVEVQTDISGKADKVTDGTENNFVSLDENGNIKDSGHKHSDYLTEHQDLSGKADKTNTVLDTTLSRGRKAGTTAGTGSVAFGNDVQATNVYSAAFGDGTKASGQNSAAFNRSTASGVNSFASGSGTTASGIRSHVEGYNSTASGTDSHAENAYTKASGNMSHAQGYYTEANHRSQTAIGEYNVLDPSSNAATAKGNYVELVGNGINSNNRSNARSLDWDGNERLKGDLYVGCNADSSGGTKVAKITDIPDVSGFYTKPQTGIPAEDIADGVIPDVSGFYTKPSGGIPATDIADGVIPDITGKADKVTVDTVTGTTPSITGVDNHRYICGEVSTLSITAPETGAIDVVFESGSTATILTTSGITFPSWFDPTDLEADATYEINVLDGYGVVMAWT